MTSHGMIRETKLSSRLSISRRGLLLAGGALGVSGLMPFSAAEAASQGGTLAMTINPEPNAMISAFNTASPVAVISGKMTEGLLHYDFELKAHPVLATGWEMSEDGLSVRFDLRQGVKWHDGKPFTSADVAYSIMEILKKYHPRGKGVFARVETVETPDDYTAILKLSEPSPAMMYALSGWESPMVPKHVYEGTDVLSNPANNAPIGTGPFKFVTWERGSHIILAANKEYWGEGEPMLDRLVVRIITDPSARVAAFEAGELHLGGDGPIPVSEVKRFRENPNFQVETRGTELNNSLDVVELNLRSEILGKPEVRKALIHALDRDKMMQVVYYGLAEKLTGPIPQSLPHLYSADVPTYDFDPAKAKQLLEAAGFPAGKDGMRFKLRLIAPAIGDTYDRAAQFMKQMFKAVGIDLELVSADVPTFIRTVYGEYDFDLSMFPASVTADPTIGSQRFYWSKAISKGTPFVNASGYDSTEMDRILEAAAIEPNVEKRKALFLEFQQLAMEDLPILPLARPIYVTVAKANVENFILGPEGVRASYGSLAFS